MLRLISALLGFALLLAACTTPAASSDSSQIASITAPASIPTSTPVPVTLATSTATPHPTVPPTISPTPPLPTATSEFVICSPLSGYPLAQLPDTVSNPFNPPAAGSDDPHQGVDLADRLANGGIAVVGMPVQAVLPGQVILAQTDRFPYGSAVIVETQLRTLPASVQTLFPTAASLWTPNPALNCPAVLLPDNQSSERSVYVLYAHLQDAPPVQVGDAVACGQPLGVVGQSGNALAPHLHLEIRIGPAGWQPVSLAHYTNDATPEEMGQYCTWRVSGFFQWVDPLALLK